MLEKHIPVLLCSILFKTYFGFRSRIAVSFGMIRYTLQSFINLFFQEMIVLYTLLMVLVHKVGLETLLSNP